VFADPVAPRFVSWALLVFGVLEIPWVIYLVFNQQTSGEAFHLKLASAGLAGASTLLCAATAWMLWRGRRAAGLLGVATTTLVMFNAMLVTLSPSLQSGGLVSGDLVPLLLALIASAGAVVAAVSALSVHLVPTSAVTRWAVAALVFVASASLVRLGQHVLFADSSELATRLRAIVVLLDTAETVGLIGAGLSSLRGRPRPTLVFATMAAVLLSCDAWVNVVAVPSGPAFRAALLFFFVGELPSVLLCLIAIRSASRRLSADLRPRAGLPA
jgi:hypothetical protein